MAEKDREPPKAREAPRPYAMAGPGPEIIMEHPQPHVVEPHAKPAPQEKAAEDEKPKADEKRKEDDRPRFGQGRR